MATRQKNRERKFSALAAADTAAPRPWTIYQNNAASVSTTAGAARALLDNDISLRGLSLNADIIGTSVKVDIKVGGTVKLSATVTVADKAVYVRPLAQAGVPVVVPAGVEISVDVTITGTCGGITAVLDTIP